MGRRIENALWCWWALMATEGRLKEETWSTAKNVPNWGDFLLTEHFGCACFQDGKCGVIVCSLPLTCGPKTLFLLTLLFETEIKRMFRTSDLGLFFNYSGTDKQKVFFTCKKECCCKVQINHVSLLNFLACNLFDFFPVWEWIRFSI